MRIDHNNFIKIKLLCIFDVVNSFGENKCMFFPALHMRFVFDNTPYHSG